MTTIGEPTYDVCSRVLPPPCATMPIWSSRPAGVPPSSDSFSLARIALPAFGPSLLFGLGEGAIYPILALSARDLGASSAQAGLIVALIGIGSMMANLPAAALANRYGERRAMIGAAVFSLAALALCLAARTPWVFGLGVLMIGLTSSVFLLARQTYLIEAVPPPMRARHVHTGGHHAGGPVRRPLHGCRLHPSDGTSGRLLGRRPGFPGDGHPGLHHS